MKADRHIARLMAKAKAAIEAEIARQDAAAEKQTAKGGAK